MSTMTAQTPGSTSHAGTGTGTSSLPLYVASRDIQDTTMGESLVRAALHDGNDASHNIALMLTPLHCKQIPIDIAEILKCHGVAVLDTTGKMVHVNKQEAAKMNGQLGSCKKLYKGALEEITKNHEVIDTQRSQVAASELKREEDSETIKWLKEEALARDKSFMEIMKMEIKKCSETLQSRANAQELKQSSEIAGFKVEVEKKLAEIVGLKDKIGQQGWKISEQSAEIAGLKAEVSAQGLKLANQGETIEAQSFEISCLQGEIVVLKTTLDVLND